MIARLLLLLLVSAVAVAAFVGVGLILWRDAQERRVARTRVLRDYDPVSPLEPTFAKKASLFALGLLGASLLTVPLDLEFLSTFLVILLVSMTLYHAPNALVDQRRLRSERR